MQIEARKIKPDDLLLDPNNYRFHDITGYRPVNKLRYAEEGVQERALDLLTSTPGFELGALRDSIVSNGFVPFEQIVVERYAPVKDSEKFLVVEGNRRVAAIKTLLRDQRAGTIELTAMVTASIAEFTVQEILGTDAERGEYQKTLMAIRHVTGVREWGSYQQAKLIVEMYESGSRREFGEIAQRIGINAREVARRYRASKALAQMEEDEEFGEFASPKLYSFFHEAVSQPKVREWLGYSDRTFRAEDETARRVFYELLSPREVNGETLPPKLQNANQQVRLLKDIVDKAIPRKILADPERTLEDAKKAAETEMPSDETGALEHALGVAVSALRGPSIDAWLSPNERAHALWSELVEMVDKIRKFMAAA